MIANDERPDFHSDRLKAWLDALYRNLGPVRAGETQQQLVLIEWLDSFGCSRQWQKLGGCARAPLRCFSGVGLVYDGPEAKVIVPHISAPHDAVDQQGCGDMAIPTRAI